MKDRLEEFVRGHRPEFDMFEPSDALWKKIENQTGKSKQFRPAYIISRVAAIAAIFLLSFALWQYIYRSKIKTPEIPELMEAEMYYSGLIDAKLKEVKPMLAEFPDIEQEMEADLTELDSVYKSLKNDLKDNVANQEVIEAMIQNYRMRIEILEEMLLFLDKENNKTNNNDNNSEYDL